MAEVTQAPPRVINLKDGISEAIREEMERDDRVFVLGEDIQDPFGGAFQITLGLFQSGLGQSPAVGPVN